MTFIPHKPNAIKRPLSWRREIRFACPHCGASFPGHLWQARKECPVCCEPVINTLSLKPENEHTSSNSACED